MNKKWVPATSEEIAAAEANLARDKEQLAVMKQKFDSFSAELEQNFNDRLESLLSDQEKEVLENGFVKDKWMLMDHKHTSEVDEKIDAARAELDAFEDEITQKTIRLENRKLDYKIARDNPELDLESFSDWVQNDIPPRLLAEITQAANGDGQKFAELIVTKYQEMIAGNDEAAKKEETKKPKDTKEFPKDMSGVAGESGDIDMRDGNSDVQNDFLAKSGMYK